MLNPLSQSPPGTRVQPLWERFLRAFCLALSFRSLSPAVLLCLSFIISTLAAPRTPRPLSRRSSSFLFWIVSGFGLRARISGQTCAR